jgi:aminoglycoside/choline kinase family phosphotransferase
MDGLYDALHAAPETMAHADLHQENLFFDGDEATFIDWQHTARAAGAYDVAKLTASCLEPGKVATEQPVLMRHYFEELQRRGVAGYSLSELERDVHLATCHYMAALLFLDEKDFAALRGDPARRDFTSQRVLAASGRDVVVAAVEGL